MTKTNLTKRAPILGVLILLGAPLTAGSAAVAPMPDATTVARVQGVAGTLTLTLEAHSVRATGFTLRVQQADGSLAATAPGASRTMRGTVGELPGARVAGALRADGFHGLLIDPGPGPDQWITPTGSIVDEAEADPSWREHAEGLAARSSRVAAPLAAGVDNCAVGGLCVAELVVDADHQAFLAAASDPLEALARAEAIVAAANLRYEVQFAITHRLTAVLVRASAAHDPYTVRCSNGAACNPQEGCRENCDPQGEHCTVVTCGDSLLGLIGLEWALGAHAGIPRDTVRVFTGQHVEFGGLSHMSGICNARNGGWVWGFEVGLVRAGIHIHELGHMWGSDHTTAGIMIPGGSDSTAPFAAASLTSIPQRRDLVDQSCLGQLVDRIFADGFESGSTAAWSSIQDPGGRLTVFSGAGTLVGTRSLRLTIASADPVWLRDDRPADERRYRARFYLDLSDLQLPELGQLRILEATSPSGGGPVVRLTLRRSGGRFLVRGRVRDDYGSYRLTPELEVPGTASQRIEIDWRAATAPAAGDGHLRLWVNGGSPVEITAVDNDTRTLEWVRLGALGVIDHPAMAGDLVLDAFDSRRDQPIGPEP